MEQGLKPFGFSVVEEMNRIGMIIDVSHLSEGGFWDVGFLTAKPLRWRLIPMRGASESSEKSFG